MMKYSIVDGEKKEPFKGGKGICECCGKETIAKCGNIKIHYWAHKNLVDCDVWWENETEWHRKWKALFPVKNQEVLHIDSSTNEKHRADIKTDKGLVIELQNSAIDPEELKSRELFYDNMIWIVNAKKFKERFHILHKLPSTKSELFKRYKFFPSKKENMGKSLADKEEYTKSYNQWKIDKITFLYKSLKFSDIEDEVEREYNGHHLFEWKNPRSVWYMATKKVYFDLGDNYIYEFLTYDEFGLKCIRKFDKETFIQRAVATCY